MPLAPATRTRIENLLAANRIVLFMKGTRAAPQCGFSAATTDRLNALLDDYTTRALHRVWRAQHFSYWMTTMLHLLPESSPFDVRRQTGELSSLTSSRAGSTYLAEAYTGWPSG